MRKIIIVSIFLIMYMPVLLAQTSYSVSDVYRITQTYRLDSTYNLAFMRMDGELPKILMREARKGNIQPYEFNNLTSQITTIEEVMSKMVIEEVFYNDPWEDDWGSWGYPYWNEEDLYYEGDIVEYEGTLYTSLMDENTGYDPVWNPDYWAEYESMFSYYLDSELIEMRIESIIGTRKEEVKFKYPLFLHFYLPAENTYEGLEKYIVSFAFEDCIELLNNYNVVWYQFTNPDWGWVKGDIFQWNEWDGKQGEFAFDILNDIYAGELILPDSIDKESAISRIEPYLNDDYEIIKYALFLTRPPDQPKIMQIYYSTWGMSEMNYIITVDMGQVLNSETSQGFMSFGEALKKGLLKPVSLDDIDTISHNGYLRNEPSPVKITEVRTVEIDPQSPIPDYKNGTYSMEITELSNSVMGVNELLFREGQEISSLILEKVNEGSLFVYANDSLKTQLTMEEFDKNLTIYADWNENWYDDWDSSTSYYTMDGVFYNGNEYYSLTDENSGNIPDKSPESWELIGGKKTKYEPQELSMLQITYRYDFNINGEIVSRVPLAIGLNVDPQFAMTGLRYLIGTFDFNEVEKALGEDPRGKIDFGGRAIPMTDLIRDHKLTTFTIYSRYIQYVE